MDNFSHYYMKNSIIQHIAHVTTNVETGWKRGGDNYCSDNISLIFEKLLKYTVLNAFHFQVVW